MFNSFELLSKNPKRNIIVLNCQAILPSEKFFRHNLKKRIQFEN